MVSYWLTPVKTTHWPDSPSGWLFTGDIDEVRIYDRALKAGEAQALFSASDAAAAGAGGYSYDANGNRTMSGYRERTDVIHASQ